LGSFYRLRLQQQHNDRLLVSLRKQTIAFYLSKNNARMGKEFHNYSKLHFQNLVGGNRFKKVETVDFQQPPLIFAILPGRQCNILPLWLPYVFLLLV
ncbi:MAG: hypothetical protein IJM10_07410, partial [Clostridia bacterium]|nr:hypothetical protein [Clostridia bacterium]